MKKINYLILGCFALCLATTFSACTDVDNGNSIGLYDWRVNLKDVEMHLELNYDEGTNTTEAVAYFKLDTYDSLDNSFIRLNGASEVRFEGQTLVPNGSLFDVKYEAIFTGLVDEGSFIWFDGYNTHVNYIAMRKAEFPPMPIAVSNNNNKCPWIGVPLTVDEEVKLYFKKRVKTCRTRKVGDTAVKIERPLLKRILGSSDPGKMRFERNWSRDRLVNATAAGGTIKTSYRTRLVDVDFQ